MRTIVIESLEMIPESSSPYTRTLLYRHGYRTKKAGIFNFRQFAEFFFFLSPPYAWEAKISRAGAGGAFVYWRLSTGVIELGQVIGRSVRSVVACGS